jgi:hypothetical protein
MATKLVNPSGEVAGIKYGTDDWAWGRLGPVGTIGWDLYGSYGMNAYAFFPDFAKGSVLEQYEHLYWRSPHVKGAELIPYHLDCAAWGMRVASSNPPPTDKGRLQSGGAMGAFCVDRHDGVIHSFFMDWSTRKVGLRELWTLKWHRGFNTAGPWTRMDQKVQKLLKIRDQKSESVLCRLSSVLCAMSSPDLYRQEL